VRVKARRISGGAHEELAWCWAGGRRRRIFRDAKGRE